MNCLEFRSIQFVLTDIEGTTSKISFVKDVMFPYSKQNLPRFLSENSTDPEVQKALSEVPGQTSSDKVKKLTEWIESDVKAAPLKKLQGMIWRQAFEAEEFKAHVYEDVAPRLRHWKKMGIQLAVYSSGSVQAQKLYFKFTQEGDMTDLFAAHFDLEIGGKKDPQSYSEITERLECTPTSILFLSDVPDELEAAKKAGLQIAQLVRPGTAPSAYPHVADFTQIRINEEKCD